ncbi:unnamed protein product [marine sediment metagenome]|uniref:Uncharacterized protein n=1 Tax=marine sediment metagenome TaxID=412755 RepID=X0SYN3_9ZZZZ
MATTKSPLRKGEKIEQGVTTKDKGTFIPPDQRKPTDPANLHRSKAEFIEVQKANKEKAAEMSKLSKEYDEKKKKARLAPGPETADKPEKEKDTKKSKPKK